MDVVTHQGFVKSTKILLARFLGYLEDGLFRNIGTM